MSTATSTNNLIDAVLAHLQSALVPAIAAASLPPLTKLLDYNPAQHPPGDMPLLWVDVAAVGNGRAGAFGGPEPMQERDRTVLVGVEVAGSTPSETMRSLRAYADLVQAKMGANQHLGGQALKVQYRSTHYSPNFGRNGSPLCQLAVLTFSIPRWVALGAD